MQGRGQDARIGRELERMVSEADHMTIIDTKYGYIDTSKHFFFMNLTT